MRDINNFKDLVDAYIDDFDSAEAWAVHEDNYNAIAAMSDVDIENAQRLSAHIAELQQKNGSGFIDGVNHICGVNEQIKTVFEKVREDSEQRPQEQADDFLSPPPPAAAAPSSPFQFYHSIDQNRDDDEIAGDGEQNNAPKVTETKDSFSHSFALRYLASVSTIGVVATAVAGLMIAAFMLTNPLLFSVGFGIAVAGAAVAGAGIYAYRHGFFSSTPATAEQDTNSLVYDCQ